uniref:Uncharacterized protein ycf18 n=1 Tax=Hildenbrandia rubra TaxID=31481 RepID=A0A1C9CG19_9FLOR|nr:phycobilisome degradation protein [Hildenbrandia rubra]AOM67312.1 phycobilisome degradation protein [Hildenbrandia rubra]
MSKSNELTLEQEFKLVIYKNKIGKLNHIQSRRYLIMILRQMLLKDNIIKYCIRNSNL